MRRLSEAEDATACWTAESDLVDVAAVRDAAGFASTSGFQPVRRMGIGWYQAVADNVQQCWPRYSPAEHQGHAEDGQRHLHVKRLTIAHVEDGLAVCGQLLARRTTARAAANRFKNAWEPVYCCRQAEIVHR